MTHKELSKKQEKFCREYVKTHNATYSAKVCGYAKKTARQQGSRLLTYPHVQKRIQELEKEAIERNNLEVNEIVSRLGAMLTFDIADLYDEDGKIKPINEMPVSARFMIQGIETDTNSVTKLKLKDTNRAIDMFLRYHGSYRKDNEQKAPKIDQIHVFQFPDNGRQIEE